MENKTILILEDEDVIRRLLSRVVSRIGCNLQTAATVKEAIAIVEKNSFDLLITDIKLPDGEGYEVIRNVNMRHPKVRIVIVTGLIPSEVHLQEMALKNIADVVQKPFMLKEMEERLRRVLGENSAQ